MYWWVERLCVEGLGVEVVAEDAEEEDCYGESVAAIVWGVEEAGEEVGFVFCAFGRLVS